MMTEHLIPLDESNIYRLSRHRYAPELNTLEFIDGSELRVPQCQTIEEALDYIKTHYA